MEPEARFNILRLKQEMLLLADEIVQGGNSMNVDRYLVTREELEGLNTTWSEYCLGLIGASYRSVLARLPITPCPVAPCPQSAAVPRIAARVARSLP